MVIDMFKYIFLNKFRFFLKLISKNKIKSVGVTLCLIISIFSLVEIYNIIPQNILIFLPLIFFIYIVCKLFQEIPIISINYQLIQFKLLPLFKLKIFILLKTTWFSILVFIIFYLSNLHINKSVDMQINLLLVINIMVNLGSFFIYQTKNSNLVRVLLLVICCIVYYFTAFYFALFLLFAFIFVLFAKKYFSYDIILPYYHSIGNMSLALINADIESLSKTQLALIKSKPVNNFNIMEKYYDNNIIFFLCKEVSRSLYYSKKYLILIVASFVCAVSISLYFDKVLYSYIGLFVIIMFVTNFLNTLNRYEYINKITGFYFPYGISNIIIQKYLAHILISLPILIISLSLKHINFIIVLICFLLIPIKSILESFSINRIIKFMSYIINILIVLLCFMGIYLMN